MSVVPTGTEYFSFRNQRVSHYLVFRIYGTRPKISVDFESYIRSL